MEWLGSTNRAMAILRVSSARQKNNTSHETQERETREYCASAGLNLGAVHELVESAKESDLRVRYNAAIQGALKGGVRHILFYINDRETRNLTDNERNEALVLSGRIVIHYVRDRKVLHKESPDSDFFLRDITAATNKQYVRMLSTRVLDGMRTKAERGWYPRNTLPLGYKHGRPPETDGSESKGEKVIIIDPNSKAVSQVIREYELRGFERLSFEQIRKAIIAEGFIAPARIATYRAGTIEQRLRNPFYRGSFEWQGKQYRGRHPLIIPSATIAAVDGLNGKRGTYRIKSGVFGGGWLKCADAECGCGIVYDPKTKRTKAGEVRVHPYYRCTNGRRVHRSLAGMNVREEDIWRQLEPAMDAVAIGEVFAQEVAGALNETQERARSGIRRQIATYREIVEQLKAKEDLAYEHFSAGVLDQDGYRRQIAKCREEQMRYVALLEKASLEISDVSIETATTILELARDAKTLWLSRSPIERRQFLEAILSNPVLDGLNVRFSLKKPFALLAEMKANGEWRTWKDSNLRPPDS